VPPLGLIYGTVELAPSDPGWPEQFELLAGELRRALGPDAVAIEHVGSTAVEGLRAKPILDLAVGLAPEADADRVIETFERLGYDFRGDAGSQGGLVFVLDSIPMRRIAHVHAVRHGDEQWMRYLAFRDRLRSDPAARAGYERLKRALANRFPNDRRAYTDGKDAFVAALLDGC
jgi:GrpB-like predicted nucleotidyltransferase (UPF0157 family)